MSNTQKHISLPVALHPFVELVLCNPAVQARLASIAQADAFVAEAVNVAHEHDIAIDPEILASALRPDPIGLGRFIAAPIEMDAWPPAGWIPTRSVPSGGAPAFDWLWFGSRPLTKPFLEDEVRTTGAMPFNWLFRIRTSLDTVVAGAQHEPCLPLKGLIFHMSRCGSTLLAQILAADRHNAVSSEPEPLDGVIQWARLAQVDAETAVPAIRAIVAALARERGTGAARHIIKLDAWHSFSLPLIRAAFPDVNWVYLYRDSIEVLVSAMQQPSLHTAPGTLPEEITGFAFDTTMSHEDFAARVLAGIGDAVVAHADLGGGMVVAYPDLREAATGRILNHFDLSPDAQTLALMTGAGRRDAKAPHESFVSDVERKHSAATPAILAAANRWMKPVEKRLNQLAKIQKQMAGNRLQAKMLD